MRKTKITQPQPDYSVIEWLQIAKDNMEKMTKGVRLLPENDRGRLSAAGVAVSMALHMLCNERP